MSQPNHIVERETKWGEAVILRYTTPKLHRLESLRKVKASILPLSDDGGRKRSFNGIYVTRRIFGSIGVVFAVTVFP